MNIKVRDNLPQSNIVVSVEDVERAKVNNRFLLTGAVPQGFPDIGGKKADADKYIVFVEYVSVGLDNTFGFSTWDNATALIPATIENILDVTHSPIRFDGGFRIITGAIIICKGFYILKN